MSKQFYGIEVLNEVTGAGIKERVPVKAIVNVNANLASDLSGSVLGGITLATNDRILFAGQTNAVENGIYIIDATAVRASDFQGDVSNTFVHVQSGTYANSNWQVTSGALVDTDALVFKMASNLAYSTGDIFYGSGNAIEKISAPASNSVLQINSSGQPVWVTGSTMNIGLGMKKSVRVSTLTNITGASYSLGTFTNVDLTSGTIFDKGALTLNVGDRILVKDQTDQKQNGIYRVTVAGATGSLVRVDDFNSVSNISAGDFVLIETTAEHFAVAGDGFLTPDTDNIVFSNPTDNTAGNGISIIGETISAKLKTNGGLEFQSTEIAVNLGASSITGILSVANGGTGGSSFTNGAVILGNGSNGFTELVPDPRKTLVINAAGNLVMSNLIYANQIQDDGGFTLLTLSTGIESDNYFNIAPAILTENPVLSAVGSDADIGLNFQSKGAGVYNFLATSSNGSTMRFFENTANGSNFVGLKAPESVTSNVSFTLPSADGSANFLLQTNGAGVLSFANPASLSTKQDISLTDASINVNSQTFTVVSYFSYNVSRYGAGTSARILFETAGATPVSIRIRNLTANTTLNTTTGLSAGFQNITFTMPSANARLVFEIRKDNAGASPVAFALQLGLF